ncbi:hypothetical protein [Nocardia sp. NPDC005825]|uniref:hypothetical protein n=1 Tax=unclassified Nocardia TaxID=2637762 RepID=UPI0033CCAB04
MATGATRVELARELRTAMCVDRGFTMHREDDGYLFRKTVEGEQFSAILEILADLVLTYDELRLTGVASLAVPALQDAVDAVPEAAVSNFDLHTGRPYSTEIAIESFGRRGSFGGSEQEILIETDDDIGPAVEEFVEIVDGPVEAWVAARLQIQPLIDGVVSEDSHSHPQFVRRLILLLLLLHRADDAVQVMDAHLGAKLHLGERESRAPKFEQHLLDSSDAYRRAREIAHA